MSYNSQPLKGEIRLSGSKSESNRVLIINYLSGNKIAIENLSDSEDTKTLQKLLSEINSVNEFDVGHAGTCMRFLTSLFAITPGERILKGSERMHQRPIKILVDTLRDLGAEIEYLDKEGFPPLKITGKSLSGSEVNLSGEVSSQYISSLMLVATYMKNGLTINITGELVSKPYITMTSAIMEDFGASVSMLPQKIIVENKSYISKSFTVESDWSSASYWYEAAAFCNEVDIEIKGLKYKNSLQADSVVKELYSDFGVETISVLNGIKLTKSNAGMKLKSHYSFLNCPDIAQTFACTSILSKNQINLTGLKTLRIKETDRVLALLNELKKFNINITHTSDALCLNPSGFIKNRGVEVSTYNDHRMAMSFAMLVFLVGEVSIEKPEVVQKSYINFWSDLKSLGVEIEEIGNQ